MGAFGQLLKQYWGGGQNSRQHKTRSRENLLEIGDIVQVGQVDYLVDRLINEHSAYGFYGFMIYDGIIQAEERYINGQDYEIIGKL